MWKDNPEIRNLPTPEGGRVETGVTRFGDDWPGIFIRGDNAFYFARCLRDYMDSVTHDTFTCFMDSQINNLIKILESCNIMNLEGAAKDASFSPKEG